MLLKRAVRLIQVLGIGEDLKRQIDPQGATNENDVACDSGWYEGATHGCSHHLRSGERRKGDESPWAMGVWLE